MTLVDFEFSRLGRSLALIDHRLDEIQPDAASDLELMDMIGVFDEIEAWIGDGFAACQRYMASRHHGDNDAFTCGPRHGDLYVADIIKACANYAKHCEEWPWPHDASTVPSLARRHTVPVLQALGVWGTERPLTGVLDALTGSSELAKLIPLLDAWREAFQPGRFVDVGSAASSAS